MCSRINFLVEYSDGEGNDTDWFGYSRWSPSASFPFFFKQLAKFSVCDDDDLSFGVVDNSRSTYGNVFLLLILLVKDFVFWKIECYRDGWNLCVILAETAAKKKDDELSHDTSLPSSQKAKDRRLQRMNSSSSRKRCIFARYVESHLAAPAVAIQAYLGSAGGLLNKICKVEQLLLRNVKWGDFSEPIVKTLLDWIVTSCHFEVFWKRIRLLVEKIGHVNWWRVSLWTVWLKWKAPTDRVQRLSQKIGALQCLRVVAKDIEDADDGDLAIRFASHIDLNNRIFRLS